MLAKLELSSVEAQYRQLLSQAGMTDAERERLQKLQLRLAELKGGCTGRIGSPAVNLPPAINSGVRSPFKKLELVIVRGPQ